MRGIFALLLTLKSFTTTIMMLAVSSDQVTIADIFVPSKTHYSSAASIMNIVDSC